MSQQIKCPICAVEFTPRPQGQRFCSPRCCSRYHSPRWRERNREKARQSDRERWAALPADHPSREKGRVRAKAQCAVVYGKLKKMPCRECGSSPAVAHHPDYSKPLEVVWLCRMHHEEEHRRLREARSS